MIQLQARSGGDDFLQFVEILAPCAEDLVALVETYFDESYDNKTLCVAGYVFTKLRCRKFTTSWKAMLQKYRLPYFRMSACAHGAKPFDHLSKVQRISVETEAIGLIKKYAHRGIAITANIGDFHHLLRDDLLTHKIHTNFAYGFVLSPCVIGQMKTV